MVTMIVSVDCASFWLFLVLLVMVPHGLTWHVIACNGNTHWFYMGDPSSYLFGCN